jgi:hypothetical protein
VTKIGEKSWLAVLFLVLNPALVFHSVEFRPYMVGFLFQVISIFYFFKYIASKKKTFSDFFILGFFTFIALLTSFSAFYLIPTYSFFIFLEKNLALQSRIHLLIQLFFITLVPAVWIVGFVSSSYGHMALRNYVSYGSEVYVGSAELFLRSFSFFPVDWGVIENSNTLKLNLTLFNNISFFISLMACITAAFFLIKLARQFYSKMYAFNSDWFFAVFMAVSLVSLFVFSELEVNVTFLRFNLIILIPFTYFLMRLLTIFTPKTKWPFLYIVTLLYAGFLLIGNSYNFSFRKYDFMSIYSYWLTHRDSSVNCSLFVYSEGVSESVVDFYNHKTKNYPFSNQENLMIMSKHEQGKQAIKNFLLTNNKNCQQIFYLNYFDNWRNKPETFEQFQKLVTNYELKGGVYVDSHLSIEEYQLVGERAI